MTNPDTDSTYPPRRRIARAGKGPNAYEGRSLSEAHTNLNITNDAFDKVAWHLRMTLEELDVERPLITIIGGFVEGARAQVVERTGF